MTTNDLPRVRATVSRSGAAGSSLFGAAARRLLVLTASVVTLNATPLAAQFGSGPQAYPHAELSIDRPTAMAFSPNDRFLAVGTDRGHIQVFDVQAGRALQEIRAAGSAIVGLAFSPDGSVVYAAAEDREVLEIQLLGGEVSRKKETDKKIHAFDLSPDGRLLMWAGDDGMVEVLNDRFMRQTVLTSPNMFKKRLVYGAFGVGGTEVFAAADEEGRSAYWQLGQPEPVRVGELVREEYRAFAKDNDGQVLALGVKAISIRVGPATGGAMAASASHSVRIMDWNRGRMIREIDGLTSEVEALAVSPDRAIVVVATRNGVMDGYSTQEARRIMSIHQGDPVASVTFSPSGSWLAAAGERSGVTVYQVSGATVAEQTNVVGAGDVLAQSAKYEFTTGREPLITTFDRFTMAVLDLDNLGVESDLAATVSNLVVSRMANVPHIDMVERGAIEQVMGELKMQNTGITSAQDAAEIGRILNAQNVLLGNVNKLGSSLTVAVRLVETESARVLGAREILCRNCQPEDLPQAITLLVSALVQTR